MLNQLSHRCAVDQTLQRTSISTNFQKKTEAKRRRLWINFVLVKRAKWTFTPTSHLCSEYFRPEDFESQFSAIHGTLGRRSLKNDVRIPDESLMKSVRSEETSRLINRLKQK